MRPHLPSWIIAIFVLGGSRIGAEEMHVLPVGASSQPSRSWLIARALGVQDKPPETPAAQSTSPQTPNTQLPAAQPPAAEPSAEQPQLLDADALAQAPTAGGEAPTGLNPRMIGDFPGIFVLRTITVPSVQFITLFQTTQRIIDANGKATVVTVRIPVGTSQVPTTVTTTTRVPVSSTSVGFKVADNQSPQPEDRVFFTYNFFSNVHGPSGPFASNQVSTQETTINGLAATVTTVIPGVPSPRVDVHGELLGFEKAFLDGRASVGLRVPLSQQQGDGSFGQQSFGDMGVLLNYALYLDRSTGNVLSGGVLVGLPTGPSVDTTVGNVHSTVLQPFMGYRWNTGEFYVQGFTSLAAPTDPRDVTLLFNDIGVGYWLYRGNSAGPLSAVIPTIEAHIATPMNHRQLTDAVSAFDYATLTSGVHLGLFSRSMITLGVATPVTGPRPFNVEAIAQFNFQF